MTVIQESLKKFTHYNPETGILKRVGRLSWKGNFIECDFQPKSKTVYGYYQLNIFGRPYLVHRLIFLYMNGELPENDVDHINGDRTDNRWCNLREVTRMENLHNMGVRPNNTTGHVGISLRSDTGSYHAYIDYNNKRIHLGNFADIDCAIEARKNAEMKYGFHKNHGARSSWRK